MGAEGLGIFEVGSRYLDSGKQLPIEERMLAVGLSGARPSQWLDSKRLYTWYDLKGIVQFLIEKLKGRREVTFEPLAETNAWYEPWHGFDLRLEKMG